MQQQAVGKERCTTTTNVWVANHTNQDNLALTGITNNLPPVATPRFEEAPWYPLALGVPTDDYLLDLKPRTQRQVEVDSDNSWSFRVFQTKSYL